VKQNILKNLLNGKTLVLICRKTKIKLVESVILKGDYMNTLYKLFVILIAGLLYTTNATAMLAQITRYKTSLAPLLTLSTQQHNDSTLCTAPILSRTYSSVSARLAAQQTLNEILHLKEQNNDAMLHAKTNIRHARESGIIGGTIMSAGGAGFCVLPTVADILKDIHPLSDSAADLLNVIALHGCPGIFMIGTGISCVSTGSFGLHAFRLARLKYQEKYLEALAKQAATKLQQNSRVDMPEDQN
jgi:hypothetical protein